MQKSTKKVMKKRLDTIFDFVLPLLLFCGAAGIGTSLLKDDFSRVAIWWLVFLVLGVVAYPVAGLIFGRFHDGGYFFKGDRAFRGGHTYVVFVLAQNNEIYKDKRADLRWDTAFD